MSLRNKLIRIAYDKPQLRNKILPLLKVAGEYTEQEWEAHKEKHPNADPKDHTITKGDKGGESDEKDSAENIDKELYEEAAKKKKELPQKIEDAYFALSDAETAYQEASEAKKSELKAKLDKAKKEHADLEEELKQAEVDVASYEKNKKASLRTQLIRLAHSKPELRKDLLPLLKEASKSKKTARVGRLHIQKGDTDLYIEPYSEIFLSEPNSNNGYRDDLMSGTFFIHGKFGDHERNGLLNGKMVFALVDFSESKNGDMYYEVQKKYKRVLPGNKDLPDFLDSIQRLIDRKFF